MGYTPVFDSILDGTLYGRWPVNGVWILLLSQADSQGRIDAVPQLLASKIGCEVETLLQCIEQLMQPDPLSRSEEYEGRRLIPLDPNRPWGWIVVNHGKYREKARLMGKAERERESGANAERMRARRADRRRPPETARDHPSYSYSYSDKNVEVQSAPTAPRTKGFRLPSGWQPQPDNQTRLAMQHGSENLTRELDAFRDYWTSANGPNAVKRDWDAALRTWMRRWAERNGSGAPSSPPHERATPVDASGYVLGPDFLRPAATK